MTLEAEIRYVNQVGVRAMVFGTNNILSPNQLVVTWKTSFFGVFYLLLFSVVPSIPPDKVC